MLSFPERARRGEESGVSSRQEGQLHIGYTPTPTGARFGACVTDTFFCLCLDHDIRTSRGTGV